MSIRSRIQSSLIAIVRRSQMEGEMDAELRFHLEAYTEDLVRSGVPRGEAMRRARIEFGGVERVKEECREVRGVGFLETLWLDTWYGLRTLRKSPGFTFIAVFVIVLCIGAATTLFTVVRSVLLRPLPFADPSQLVMLYEHFRDPALNAQGFSYVPVAPADYYDWRAKTHGFEDMAAWRYGQFTLAGTHGELPELVDARGGTWNLFSMLAVRAAIGRTFVESDDRRDGTVVLLTWSLFQRRFGGDASIVGRQIHLDATPYTVVGVLPKWFAWSDAENQLWIPFRSGLKPALLARHDFRLSHVVARVKPGVSLASALSQVEAVQVQLHLQNLNAPVAEDVASKTLTQDLTEDVRKPLILLLSAAGCMLLIGCLNVANLMVARSAARQREVAIRSALGARRLTLIRGQLAESTLISLAGGLAGVLLSLAGTRWLVTIWQALPSAQSIHPDGVVLAFACALVVASVLLAGLLPAISSTGRRTLAAMQASSRTTAGSPARTSLRRSLLTVEIATTVLLLVAAGLLLKSYWRQRTADLGCPIGNVLTMSYSLPLAQYDTPGKVNAFNEALLERVRATAGVRAAGLGFVVPGGGVGSDNTFTIPGHPPLPSGAPPPDALYRTADPGYFSALRIPLLSGRFFTADDRIGHPKTIIISHELAQQYFPGENPLGKEVLIGLTGNNYEIVGVVGDTLYQVGKPAFATFYLPVLSGDNSRGFSLVVRTVSSDPLTLAIPIQKQIAQLNPQLPVSDVLTLRQIVDQSLGNASLSATLVLAFAMLSLLMASVGLYGVLSYLTTQRNVEIGIRIALGAKRRQVLGFMLGDGLRPALYGLALGLAAAAATVRLFQSMLYHTDSLDPVVFAEVAGTQLLVATFACLVPAWRASRIDPMRTLRTE